MLRTYNFLHFPNFYKCLYLNGIFTYLIIVYDSKENNPKGEFSSLKKELGILKRIALLKFSY